MPEYISPETLNAIMSELTADTLVGVVTEMAQKGNFLIHEDMDRQTIEKIQNYRFLDPITLQDCDIIVLSSHLNLRSGPIAKPSEICMWIENDDDDEADDWYWLVQDPKGIYHPQEPITEGLGYQLITLLDRCELLDDMTPEDWVDQDSLLLSRFRKRYPD